MTEKYDFFSQMTLKELIENEKAAKSFLNSSSDFLKKESLNDLKVIRKVMKVVYSYNWISKKVKGEVLHVNT